MTQPIKRKRHAFRETSLSSYLKPLLLALSSYIYAPTSVVHTTNWRIWNFRSLFSKLNSSFELCRKYFSSNQFPRRVLYKSTQWIKNNMHNWNVIFLSTAVIWKLLYTAPMILGSEALKITSLKCRLKVSFVVGLLFSKGPLKRMTSRVSKNKIK